MVALYVRKINENTMTLDEVPPLWREKVRIALEAQNTITS
jgi:hypothetical protein